MFGRTDGSAASAANARSASGVVGSVGRMEMSSTNTDPPVRKARVRSGSGSAIQLSSSFSDIRSSADQWNDAITPRTRVRGLTRRSLAAAERERSDSMGGLRSLSRHASGGHEVNEVVGNLDDDDSNEDGTTSGGAQPTRVHGLEHLEKMNYHHSWHGRDTHLIEQWVSTPSQYAVHLHCRTCDRDTRSRQIRARRYRLLHTHEIDLDRTCNQ